MNPVSNSLSTLRQPQIINTEPSPGINENQTYRTLFSAKLNAFSLLRCIIWAEQNKIDMAISISDKLHYVTVVSAKSIFVTCFILTAQNWLQIKSFALQHFASEAYILLTVQGSFLFEHYNLNALHTTYHGKCGIWL